MFFLHHCFISFEIRSVMMAYEITEKLHSRKINTSNHENILSEESVNCYFEDYHRCNVSNKEIQILNPHVQYTNNKYIITHLYSCFQKNMHFEKELMENEDVEDGHSVIDEMAKLIESSDE